MITLIVIAVVVVIVGGWIWLTYNRFINLTVRTGEAWADIDVQLKRRYDLIPNLIETVKGYAAHEQGVFQKVTEARTAAMGANTPAQKAQTENMLTDTLKSLFAVAENYPDLKANQNFLHLQQELTDTENKIQASRRFYNGNVRDLNASLQSFPGNIIGGAFGFVQREFFELGEDESAAREPVAVKF